MQVGIGLPNQIREVDAAILPGWAAQAEEAGFASLATIGRIAYPGVMDTIALAVAAASTTTIGLISAIAVGPAYPAVLLAKEAANRARWKDAGRTGAPRLVALAYYAFDDIDAGRANIHDYCSSAGEQFAGLMTGNISHGADGVRATMKAFEEIGADELIFSPAVSDPAEIGRLAEAVL